MKLEKLLRQRDDLQRELRGTKEELIASEEARIQAREQAHELKKETRTLRSRIEEDRFKMNS